MCISECVYFYFLCLVGSLMSVFLFLFFLVCLFWLDGMCVTARVERAANRLKLDISGLKPIIHNMLCPLICLYVFVLVDVCV